jgi:hypothetical protein
MSTTTLPVPTDPAAPPPTPPTWDLRIAAERLALVAESTDWDLPQAEGRPLQGEPLRDWCAQRHDLTNRHLTELGLGLWLAKKELGHGAFLGWLQEAGIPNRTAQDAIQLARLIFGAPPAAVATVTALPRRKLQALAPGGQMLLEALTQDGTLAEVPAMKREEIRALVQERIETQRLRERLDAICEQRDALIAKQRELAALPAPNRRLAALRLSALEEIERLRATGLALHRIVTELQGLPPGLDEPGYDAACHALVYALEGLQSLTDRALADGYGLREHYTATDRMPPPLMTDEDAHRAREWANRFLAEADLRQARGLAASSAETPKPARRGTK